MIIVCFYPLFLCLCDLFLWKKWKSNVYLTYLTGNIFLKHIILFTSLYFSADVLSRPVNEPLELRRVGEKRSWKLSHPFTTNPQEGKRGERTKSFTLWNIQRFPYLSGCFSLCFCVCFRFRSSANMSWLLRLPSCSYLPCCRYKMSPKMLSTQLPFVTISSTNKIFLFSKSQSPSIQTAVTFAWGVTKTTGLQKNIQKAQILLVWQEAFPLQTLLLFCFVLRLFKLNLCCDSIDVAMLPRC